MSSDPLKAPRSFFRYCISDGSGGLVEQVKRLGDSIDLFQIRERDRDARDLAVLTRAVMAAAHPQVRVLVNDRADVAWACGAHGVHLRSHSLAPSELRRALPAGFLISVSCHSVADVMQAERESADMALLAPIFETPGKGAALGLGLLAVAAQSVRLPVLALGGVTEAQVGPCLAAGAGGVAGIRLFSH